MIVHTANISRAQGRVSMLCLACLQSREDAPFAEIDSESFEIEVGLDFFVTILRNFADACWVCLGPMACGSWFIPYATGGIGSNRGVTQYVVSGRERRSISSLQSERQ